jgi:hypothetical protein
MTRILTQILCATTCGLSFVTGCHQRSPFGVVRSTTRTHKNAILRVVINEASAGRLPLTIGAWRDSYEGRNVTAI